jgi:hypothetical protein
VTVKIQCQRTSEEDVVVSLCNEIDRLRGGEGQIDPTNGDD